MSESTAEDVCPICKCTLESSGDVVEIRQKGADGINDASIQRGDNIVVTAGCHVHSDCRKNYVNRTEINRHVKRKQGTDTSTGCAETCARSTRSSAGPFDSRSDCFLCGTPVNEDSADYSYVKTDNFTRSILQCCDDRSDDWSLTVKSRIEFFAGDLHAADCVYHHTCSSHFRCGRGIPLQFQKDPETKRRKSGKPLDEEREQAFTKMCLYLEANDDEQLTISDLVCKMNEFLNDVDSIPYSRKYVKSKLKEIYGTRLHFAEREGLDDIVTMAEKTSNILRSYYNTSKQDGDEEAQTRAIIETAAKLIKNDIKRNVKPVSQHYPCTEALEIQSAIDYIPESLRVLLRTLFTGIDTRRKVASIGHAVVQAVRPRAVVAPLQIGLALQMHHLYRSRFLIDTLFQMGFCSSYSEVHRFQMNSANCIAPNMLDPNTDASRMTLLLAADNVDHNILTIDGKGTFHGMGMVAALTPATRTVRTIPRKKASELNIIDASKVPIVDYCFKKQVHKDVIFKELPRYPVFDKSIDLLWELSFNFKEITPGWHGMMHIMHQGQEHPGQSSVTYLPMIDMYSGDKTCILSTLEFLYSVASEHHFIPVVTFDQPLFWKASNIISDSPPGSHLRNIVLLLGNFHTFMNLLITIGTLMNGTGLKEILEVVYGENAVCHMLSGKSVQRAFRGHLLVDKCLSKIITSEIATESETFAELIAEAEVIYTSLANNLITCETASASQILGRLQQHVEERKSDLSSRSKTSALWLNYQNMLQVARLLVMADRTGSWSMHLHAVCEAIPIFAAAGHYNYLKSAHLYLQNMTQLHITHPELSEKFHDGLHVIRRSQKFWSGLSSDLVIEQTLMRSLKTSGGLTRGSGLSEGQRALWTMSTPVTAEYNMAMQEFANLSYSTSEQHKELTDARIKRDNNDLQKISAKLVGFSPFAPDPSLRNIVTGVVAHDGVNVHEYKGVSSTIMQKMVGQPVFTYSFSRKDKARTLAETTSIPVGPDRTIDCALLFQRFLVVAKTGELSLQDVMSHELSPFPPALFETTHVFRKADKPQLAHALSEHTGDAIMDSVPTTESYVLDGGSLIHRLTWRNGDTYGAIAQLYADFTVRHYGSTATIVFDGYEEGPSIKDNTHLRRGHGIQPVVNFITDTQFSGKKENFLSRDSNKQSLIRLVSAELRNRGCTVVNAPGDADVEIVKAAVSTSLLHTTTLVGEDTDLLILLLHYTQPASKNIYFRSDRSKGDGSVKVYHINRMKEVLGNEMCSHLLFIHALTGCDSTSRIFGVGKKTAFQKFMKGDAVLRSCASSFITPNQTTDIIDDLGCQVIAVLFGGKCNESLAEMRYKTFSKKVVGASSFVSPERLPPTASATKHHSRRVYYQVMVWMEKDEGMDALQWGWRLQDNRFTPVMSSMKVAPDSLLKVIHCNCCNSCKTLQCSCRRNGLPCTSACGKCQVTRCDNVHETCFEEESDDDVE